MAVASFAAATVATSCLGSDGETIPLEFESASTDTGSSSIPSDVIATENPSVDSNVTVPNFGNSTTTDSNSDSLIVELYLPGIKYPDSSQWLYLVGTDGASSGTQNVWVSVDETPKGCTAWNNSAGETVDSLDVDMVFLVDNSSNMNAPGDILASELYSWAAGLKASNISLKCATVGYGGSETDPGVDGAMDLCDPATLLEYLTADSVSGTARTKGYGGQYASYLSKISTLSFSNCSGECGVEALRYADAVFDFRDDACRVYINFTDEANQPNGDSQWSVEYLSDQTLWPAYKGLVHTVFSGNAAFSEQEQTYEWPWRMSEYTGGITYYTDSSLSDITLDGLEATTSIKNYYVVRFKIPSSLADGELHTVRITVLSTDYEVQADKSFEMTF